MDNSLIDQDDPEKRIADLEHQLAERKRGAGLPPAGPHDTATARRFVAMAAPPSTKQMMKYTYVVMFGAMASLGAIYMALFLVGALLGTTDTVMKVGGPVVFFAFLLGAMPAYAMFQRRVNREKTVLIDVGAHGLTVSSRPGDVFTFGDAQLGKWTLAGYGGATKGTALHLRSGRHRFVLGGQDHRVAPETPLEAQPVDSVDASMWGPEFDELLTIVGRPRGLEVHGPTPGQPIRCVLVPNPMRMYSSSFFGMFKNTATALRLNANPPQPGVAIDVGDDAISVIDLTSNARLASASLAQVTATPAASTRSVPRMGVLTTAVLVVRVANSQPLTLGCPDWAGPPQASWSGTRTKLTYRFAWRGEVPAEEEPAFVVSDADWLTLVEKFGLAPRLEDRARPDAAGAPAPGETPLARPKRKLWIYAVVIAAIMFVVAPAMMFIASNVQNNRQNKADQLTADRERPFALPFTDLRVPHGVAVDAAGNVYVTDAHTNHVLKLAAGSSTPTVLPFTGLDFGSNVIDAATAGVAVDAAGNVYVADSDHSRVVKLAAGSSTQTVLPFKGLDAPQGVAVDSAGTVYVVDYSHGQVLKLAAGSSTQTVLPSSGNGASPNGNVAVDATGNVYVGFSKTHRRGPSEYYVMRLAPGSDTWTTLPTAPDNFRANLSTGEQDLAVDTRGNVYVITSTDTRGVWKLVPGSDNWTQLQGAPPLIDPLGLAVDPGGRSVYVTDHVGSRATGSGLPWEKDDAQGFVLKLPAG
jgi:sugar lactone lactonase YvrE